MRVIPIIFALALGITLASPAAAEFYFSARAGASYGSSGYSSVGSGSKGYNSVGSGSKGYNSVGSGHLGYKSSGFGVEIRKGSGAYRGGRGRHHKYYKHYRPRRWRPRGIYLYGRRYDDRDRKQPANPAPPPPPPVVVAPIEPLPPPDPRGPLRFSLARGIPMAQPAYKIGEALPSDLPHVTLDWRQFDLPEPPAGQIYARVKRDVLLITATGRIVKKVVPQG